MRYTESGPHGYYFEEVAEGATYVTRGRTITESDIVQFAALTGDYNPMHTDAVYMETHPMGQRIAHGMLSLSYAIGQIYQLGFMERTVLAFRSVDVKFSLPVFIGDTLHSEVTITEKKAARRMGGGLITASLRIINQEGKTVTSGSLVLLLASQPEAS
jgi:3-hydroxybutyryl-CoA dehydratase